MDDTEDLNQLIRAQIDEPAVRDLREMHQQGVVTKLDVEKFRTSVQQYKSAILDEYANLDPAVRQELIKSLLSDYQMMVNSMIMNISKRAPVVVENTANGRHGSECNNSESAPEQRAIGFSAQNEPTLKIKQGESVSPWHGYFGFSSSVWRQVVAMGRRLWPIRSDGRES